MNRIEYEEMLSKQGRNTAHVTIQTYFLAGVMLLPIVCGILFLLSLT